MEPKGWSEAMELDNHELEGWEGPTPGEVAKEVAVEVCYAVLSTNHAIHIGNNSAMGSISVTTCVPKVDDRSSKASRRKGTPN